MKKAMMCIVETKTKAEALVTQLQTDGVNRQDISVLLPDTSGTRDFAHEHNTKAPEGAITGVGAGGLVGGALGLLVGIGALAIPGVGPLIAAGPLLATLSGAAAGATVGGVAGGLIGLGIPEIEARQYEGKIKSGNILISVHTDRPELQHRVEASFKAARAQDIFSTGSTPVPSVPDRGNRPATF